MRETGQLGEIYIVQGSYSQDWLFYDTDWNWRIDQSANGRSRTLADIGSHWCDMIEFLTALRISSVCADLQTFHKTRKRPKMSIETFAGKLLKPEEIGVQLTEGFMMDPEASVSALVFHHPDCTYFSAGNEREE